MFIEYIFLIPVDDLYKIYFLTFYFNKKYRYLMYHKELQYIFL